MTDKMKEMLKFAQEMEDAGVTDGSTTKRIAARIKAKELQAKYKHPTPMTGEDIKRIREQNNISQSSLALILNMTKESVSKWERNEIKPNGAALRLLHLIDNYSSSFLKRIKNRHCESSAGFLLVINQFIINSMMSKFDDPDRLIINNINNNM